METIRKILSPILLPLSLIYGLVVYVRNRLYDNQILLKSAVFKIPVIVVGNITVGGTGKTPHTEYLVELLKNHFKVAVLSRGYKRKTSGFLISTPESTSTEIGDEPLQIKQKFPDTIVAVDGNRVRGIRNLLEKFPDIDVVLLDDAYQHRRVKANMNILLIDYSKPICKDFILPFGNLREHASEKHRANIILITKTPNELKPIDRRIIYSDIKAFPYQDVYFTTFDYGNLVPVFDHSKTEKTRGELKDYQVLLFTGIANPKPLIDFLSKTIGNNIHLSQFPDHYQFTNNDIEQIEKKFSLLNSSKKVIITTEKDAMRLQIFSNIAENLKKNWYYLPVKVIFQNKDSDEFNKKIIEYVRKNKTHSFLYPG